MACAAALSGHGNHEEVCDQEVGNEEIRKRNGSEEERVEEFGVEGNDEGHRRKNIDEEYERKEEQRGEGFRGE